MPSFAARTRRPARLVTVPPTATTDRRPAARCRKHAFAPRPAWRPRSSGPQRRENHTGVGLRTHVCDRTTVGPVVDAETGFQYLRARYYDPATGQFLTRDPIEAETREPYGYVGGNPLNETDPAGLNKCEVGANPFRWAGNAADCVAKRAKNIDYVSLDISAFSPVGPIPFGPGGGAVVTLTRSGHVYVAPQIGFGLAGPSGALRAGALDHPQGAANSACRNAQVDKFISGWGATISANAPVVGPVGVSLAKTAGFPGKATEAGVGIQPDLSVTASYGFSAGRTPWSW